jgi:hypothetical protein
MAICMVEDLIPAFTIPTQGFSQSFIANIPLFFHNPQIFADSNAKLLVLKGSNVGHPDAVK